MLQAGRSPVQDPMRCVNFSIYIILPAALWLVHRADNLTTIYELTVYIMWDP
jgi:hypothetical protein